MTEEQIRNSLLKRENTTLEFKEARNAMPSSLFETVCAFLNKDGGIILLGVDNEGKITGIDSGYVDGIITNIVTSSNDPDCLNPPFILSPKAKIIDEKNIIYIKIPSSSQVHDHGNVVFDRENDSDFRINDGVRVSAIYNRKRNIFTEGNIYDALSFNDFQPELFSKVRNLIKSNRADHPWLAVTDERLLELANLKRRDFQTGKEGYTLAAALLFGKDEIIQQILPAYKIDAIVRKDNVERYDDRLILRTNLIDSYDELLNFIAKHLPEKFYMEKGQHISLRTRIFREIVGNIIAHREYMNPQPTSFVIFKDHIEVTNPNNPHFRGPIEPDTFSPFPKNPTIAKFLIELGRVEELGSGIISVNKYLPLYFEECKPVFIENDIFKTLLPTIPLKLGIKADLLLTFLNIEHSSVSKDIREKFRNLTLDQSFSSEMHNDDMLLHSLITKWLQTGIKYKELDIFNNKQIPDFDLWKSIALDEKGVKLYGKKFVTIVKVLFATINKISLADMMNMLEYKNRASFREKYLKPLINDGFIKLTIPENPNSPKQKYVIANKGLLWLGGFEI